MKCVVLSFRCALTALLALSGWTCLKADAVLLSSGGRVTFGECSEWCMSPLIYGNGGKLWGVSVGAEPDAADCSACYEFMLGGRKPVKWASGKISLASEGGRVRVSLTCEVTGGDISRGGAGMLLSLPAGMFSNRVWRIDGGAWRNFPGRPLGVGFVKSAKLSSFAVDAPGGAIELRFDSPAFFSWRDPQNGNGAYLFRFAPMGQGSLAKNSLVMFSFLVSRLDGTPISPRTVSHFVVKAGKDWIPCIYRKTPEKGSALDFSCMGQLDAPAGKYGFLKACGGHFEFENRPGVPVRFWGANITSSACFPKTAELAAELAERLSRIGYNSVRIHHHDFGCVYRTGDPGRLNPDYIDRLDRFLHECIKRGLYITTDLYVSRDVKWRDIGLDRDGFVGHNRFKGEILYREAAYSNYCAFAKAFLTHVNRYTGRRYADEPALNLISLVNEGLFFSGWNSLSKEPLFRATWKSWLEQRRREDPSYFPGFSVDEPPQGIYNQKVVEGGRADILTEFSVHMEKRFYERMRAFLKGIGVKALLTDVNFGPSRPGMKELRRNFDYIDMHFYYEHPKKAGGRTFIPNRHPLDRPEGEGLQFDSKRYHDRPFTISEYNWSGPCAWRGTGALIGAAVASLQDWSGIWRFAYAQHSRVLPENAEGPSAFDVAVDPVNYVAERAAIALYLRGDMPAMPYKGAFRLPELNNSFFRTDAKTLSAVVDTERTVGGCALAGNSIKAGAMDVHVQGSPACVWATTLDGYAIKKSKRILFAHLTDVLGEGTEFLDSTRRHLLKWGKRPLVQTGIADVRIQLDSSNAYRVYRLDMAGVRCGVVESRMQNGTLSFRADVAYNPQSATICYEICDEIENFAVSARNGFSLTNQVECRKGSGDFGASRLDVEWLFRGDERMAYRDPAAVWVDGVCHLFFTLIETDDQGGVSSYVATAQSSDFKNWSSVRKLTPRTDRDYSSPGNLVKDGDDWVLCFQSYPRPGNRNDGVVRYADKTARLFTMRTCDFKTWTEPELMFVKGPSVSEAEMGRMIDPYLLKVASGGWMCFYKQQGASFSRSSDLKEWTFAGRTDAGENVCIVQENGIYWMMHSPRNGMCFKKSEDLMKWTDVPGNITLNQSRWPWARGRITAGFLLDCSHLRRGKWGLFFHASGPRTESEGDFDRNASIGVVFSSSLDNFFDTPSVNGVGGLTSFGARLKRQMKCGMR